jgi:hypothetical protein
LQRLLLFLAGLGDATAAAEGEETPEAAADWSANGDGCCGAAHAGDATTAGDEATDGGADAARCALMSR